MSSATGAGTGDSFDLDDDDRLPWLESAEDYEEESGYSPARIALFLGAAILLLALLIGGIYWYQNRDGAGLSGDGQLIAAQEGDFKVRPEDPQSKEFEGEGDASFAASEGKETPAKLGTVRPAETPVRKPEAKDAPGSALIQLGAFSSAGLADRAWSGFANRFSDIGSLPKKIVRGSVQGGTIYRLNAVAPNAAQAQKLCNNLKAAGESCLVID